MANKIALPPLQSLVVFESAARYSNFTLAADELNTTQPAVSQRIREVEKNLGVQLFKRLHRGVSLTDEGRKLFEAVQDSLANISATIEDIRTHGGRKVLSLATDFGFAAYWLMPRLSKLRSEIPELELRILTSQGDFDIRNEPVDFAIKFGNGPWRGCHSEILFPEIVIPVCSPAFAKKHNLSNNSNATVLATVPLLHLEDNGPTRWLTWQDWLNDNKVVRKNRKFDAGFNDYSLVLQAAIASQGVALGWVPLINEPLRNEQLSIVTNQSMTTVRGYYLLSPTHKPLINFQRDFYNWLLEESRQDAKTS